MEGSLTIGAFSRAALLSIPALRAYHEAGILVPDHVHPTTGYRSYTLSQLADAAIVRRLRELDLPLPLVATIVAARDPEVTRSVLADHALVMSDRLAQTLRIVGDLQRGLQEPGTHTPVHLKPVEVTTVLSFSGVVKRADYSAFLDQAFGEIFAVLMRSGREPSAAGGALYPTEIGDELAESVKAFVPVRAEDFSGVRLPPGVALGELPAATMAVLSHTGTYEDIGGAYRSLGSWVAQHAAMSGAPVREIYIVSPPQHTDASTYITELQWPVTTHLEENP
jgi:DNA-binding transcriptional MerR regulator